MPELSNKVTVKGKPVTLVGNPVEVGDEAPSFSATTQDLQPFDFSSLRGRAVLLTSVPSLDTSVCATETRRFSEELAKMRGDAAAVLISMDLPFAQQRWCQDASVSNIVTVSDHAHADFGHKYGVLVKEMRLLARAVWVVDKNNRVTYKELLGEMTDEPDYDRALEAMNRALNA